MKTHAKLFLAFALGIAAIAQGLRPAAPRGETYAIVIGTNLYNDRGVEPLQFAKNDAARVGQHFGAGGSPAVRLLVNDTTPAMKKTLRAVLLETANENDSVVIFLSARGVGIQGLKGYNYGFVLGSDSKSDNPLGTALTTDELNSYIHKSRAREIWLFADLCRAPAEKSGSLSGKTDNPINLILKDSKYRDSRLAVFTASQPNQLSLENKDLGGGHGVFGYYLVEAFQNRGVTPTVKSVYDYLNANVSSSTRRKQIPDAFGLLKNNIQVPPPSRRISVRRSRPFFVLASFGGDDQAPDTFARDQSEIALENDGQQVLNEYGEGDQFPGDRTRPGKDDFERAAKAFQRVHDLETRNTQLPEDVKSQVLASLQARQLFCTGRASIFGGDYDKAEQALRQAASLYNSLPQTYNALGIVALERTRYDDAIKNFEKAIEPGQAPNWAYARHNLALTYIEKGDNAAAERTYREAIRRTPYHPYLYYNLGVLYQRTNRKSEAEQQYRLALEKFEDEAMKFTVRAEAWRQEKNQKEADRTLERARVLRQNEAQAYNALGALYQSRGKTKLAIRNYTEARNRDSEFALPAHNLGSIYFKRARNRPNNFLKLAMQAWEEALKIDSRNVPSHLRLAEAYSLLGDFAQSVDHYQKAEGIQAHIAEAPLAAALGDLNRKQERAEEACRDYTKALKLGIDPVRNRDLQRKIKATCK